MSATLNPPLVSVILPVYNQEKFIRKTIESILSQTFKEFELIILDDGSTDCSAQIIKEYQSKDPRIKAYFHSNSGRSEATNKAVSYSSGKYCALIDADDLMVPERLERQVAFHRKHPDIEASASHCYYIDEYDKEIGTQRYIGLENRNACKKAMDEKGIIICAITTLMISRKAFDDIGGLDKTYWPADDLEFSNRILEKGYLLVIIQEYLAKYRIHSQSETASKQWHLFEVASFTYHNISLRRQGQPTITFDEFKAHENAASWRKRLKLKAHRYAIIYHKKAGFSYHKKNYFLFVGQLFLAIVFDQRYVLSSVKRKFWTLTATAT